MNIPKNIVVSQIPIDFKQRHAGESKMNLKVLWDLLLVIIHSFLKKYVPREYLSYIGVGMIGLSFHVMSLYLLYKIIGISFLSGSITGSLFKTYFDDKNI